MSAQAPCPAGFFCSGGVQYPCPGGTYVLRPQSQAVTDCLPCTPGGYCPPAAAAPVACGSDSVYCPAGVSAPLPIAPGNLSVGAPGARSGSAPCPAGLYCPGDGRGYSCPAGRYGAVQGLSTSACSGACADGVLCANQTTSAAGVPCPQGQYCVAGLAFPCPPGTYNPSTGGGSVGAACEVCPAGRYNPSNGSTSALECAPCDVREWSAAGSSACWPGILGVCGWRWLGVWLGGGGRGVVGRCEAPRVGLRGGLRSFHPRCAASAACAPPRPHACLCCPVSHSGASRPPQALWQVTRSPCSLGCPWRTR
jgi:hypothetical protein